MARAGARLSYEATEYLKPFGGLYYEYDFGGQAESHNRVARMSNYERSLKGSSDMAELGLAVNPNPAKDLVLKLAVKGHAGQREGVSGQFSFNWNF